MIRWKMRTAAVLVAVLAVLTMGVTAPAGAGAESKPTRGGSLTVANNVEPTVLDPVRLNMSSAGGAQDPMYFAIFGVLVYEDNATKTVKPLLAESFKSSDQGKTWVLKLRPNLKFSDGTALDATAVKTSWDRAADPSTGSQYVGMSKTFTYVVNDPTTITITLNTPNTLFDRSMTTAGAFNLVGSPKAFAELKGSFGTTPVGAGPYVVKEWVRQNHITLQRNPLYFDKPRPYLDSITMLYLPQEDQRWNVFEAGQTDMMWTSRTTDYAAAKNNPDMRSTLYKQIGWQGLVMNVAVPPINDVDVRRALVLATNQQQAASAGWPGSPGAAGIYQKWTPYYAGPYPKTDVAAGQKLIDGYLKRTGAKSVDIEVSYPANNAYTNMATVLKAQWERLSGVSVKLTASSTTLGNTVPPMIGPAVLVGCCYPDPQVYNRYSTQGTLNTTKYSNPAVDEAFAKARSTTDPKVQNAQWKKAGELITKDVAVLPIADYTPDGYVYYKKVRGIVGFSNAGYRPDLIYVKS